MVACYRGDFSGGFIETALCQGHTGAAHGPSVEARSLGCRGWMLFWNMSDDTPVRALSGKSSPPRAAVEASGWEMSCGRRGLARKVLG